MRPDGRWSQRGFLPRNLLAVTVILSAFLATASFGAAAASSVDLQTADAAAVVGRWPEAAAAYAELAAAAPGDGQLQLRLGRALRELGRFQEAVDAFRRAIDAGVSPLTAQTGLASALAGLGESDAAFAALEQAVQAGLPPAALQSHPALASLRGDSRFTALLATANALAFPCEHDATYRAFDFWVGDWIVSAGGGQVGTNRIERSMRGCVLIENWTDGYGNRGTSLNYLDPVTGTWRQNWIDEGGRVVLYEGEIRDGKMHFKGESRQPASRGQAPRTVLSRVLLEPLTDGTVRHLVERSSDQGTSWNVVFDATYTRSAPREPS